MAQADVGRLEMMQVGSRESSEERTQRIAMWKFGKPEQGWQEAIELEILEALDTTQACHFCIKMGQEEIGRVELAVAVTGPSNTCLQEAPKPYRFAKLLKKDQSAEARNTMRVDENIDFPKTLGHLAQTYLKRKFVQSSFYRQNSYAN